MHVASMQSIVGYVRSVAVDMQFAEIQSCMVEYLGGSMCCGTDVFLDAAAEDGVLVV